MHHFNRITSVASQNSSDLNNRITLKKSSVCILEMTVTHKEDRINRKEISKETLVSSMNKTNKTTSGHLKNIDRKQNSDQIKGSAKSNTHNNIICRKENFNQTLEASSILGENDKISLRGHSDHDIKHQRFTRVKKIIKGLEREL